MLWGPRVAHGMMDGINPSVTNALCDGVQGVSHWDRDCQSPPLCCLLPLQPGRRSAGRDGDSCVLVVVLCWVLCQSLQVGTGL